VSSSPLARFSDLRPSVVQLLEPLMLTPPPSSVKIVVAFQSHQHASLISSGLAGLPVPHFPSIAVFT